MFVHKAGEGGDNSGCSRIVVERQAREQALQHLREADSPPPHTIDYFRAACLSYQVGESLALGSTVSPERIRRLHFCALKLLLQEEGDTVIATVVSGENCHLQRLTGTGPEEIIDDLQRFAVRAINNSL